MGLFKSKNQRMFEDVMRQGMASGSIKAQRKMVQCPKCGQRYTVTFLNSNDSKTCNCGYKIYCD